MGIKSGNVIKFENLIGSVNVVNWVENVIDQDFRRNLEFLFVKTKFT